MLTSASLAAEAQLRHNQIALNALRRRWLWVTFGYGLATLGSYLTLRILWSEAAAGRWLLLTALFALRPLWLLWHHLDENHRPGEAQLLPTLGYGNAITLARGWCLAAVAGFLFSPWPTNWLAWLPSGLYLFAVILDGFDGYVARVTHHTTKLGATLDITLDAWGLLGAIFLAVWYGQLPLWYLPLAASRELFVAGQWWLRRQGKPTYPLTPSAERRAIAGLQMGFVGMVLWPIFSAPATTIAAVLFGGQLLASFARDWLVVSGALDPASAAYQRWRQRIKLALQGWLPVALRLVAAAVAVAVLRQALPAFEAWWATGSPAGVLRLGLWLLLTLWAASVLLVTLGIVPRLAAGALLLLALWDQQLAGFAWSTNGVLEAATILIIQLGGGRWSLWRADDRLWYAQAGPPAEAAS